MTPHTASNGRGTLLFDRQFDGVGRIRTASGTRNVKLFKQLDRMLTRLHEARKLEVLLAIKHRRLKPLDAFVLYEGGDLAKLPSGAGLAPLTASWETWVKRTPHDMTRATRRQAGKLLQKQMPPAPLLAHLPAALRAFRQLMEEPAKPAQFNRVRSAALAYLRDTMGTQDATYLEVLGVPSMKEIKAKRPAPPPDRALAIAEALPGEAGRMWWSMYVTGMGRREYWGRWEVGPDGDRVAIHGPKRSARERVVPLIDRPTAPAMHHKTYEKLFQDLPAALGDVEPYDARRGYAHLTELAGIPPTRRKQLMGHSLKGDVTDGYSGVNLEDYLTEDREALRAVVAKARVKRKAATKARLQVG